MCSHYSMEALQVGSSSVAACRCWRGESRHRRCLTSPHLGHSPLAITFRNVRPDEGNAAHLKMPGLRGGSQKQRSVEDWKRAYETSHRGNGETGFISSYYRCSTMVVGPK